MHNGHNSIWENKHVPQNLRSKSTLQQLAIYRQNKQNRKIEHRNSKDKNTCKQVSTRKKTYIREGCSSPKVQSFHTNGYTEEKGTFRSLQTGDLRKQSVFLAILGKTVKIFHEKARPSVVYLIATDWVPSRYLKWCLMYSRHF